MGLLKHKICNTDDIGEGESRGFKIEEKSFFVVKRNSKLVAYENTCPHLGVELDGIDDKFLSENSELIQCHFHGALFTIEDGDCIAGPCAGEKLIPVAVEQVDQWLYVSVQSTDG